MSRELTLAVIDAAAGAGAKTMLDVLVPAVEVVRAGGECGALLVELRRAAAEGREATKPMRATRGRASFLGERSVGHVDPGGLLRTEFLFLGRDRPPDEEEQHRAYAGLLERLAGKPLLARTLDAGGDKPVLGVSLPREDNPFLGLRGIRLCLERPELFRPQARALLRASARGPLKVMLPMVAAAGEVAEARAFFAACLAELRAEGVPAALPPIRDAGRGPHPRPPRRRLLLDRHQRPGAVCPGSRPRRCWPGRGAPRSLAPGRAAAGRPRGPGCGGERDAGEPVRRRGVGPGRHGRDPGAGAPRALRGASGAGCGQARGRPPRLRKEARA